MTTRRINSVGIVTPYRNCDVTHAALRLADLALANALDVHLLADQDSEKGVDAIWDQTRLHKLAGGIARWARQCDYMVWFRHIPRFLPKAREAAKEAKQCLVLLPHVVQPGDLTTKVLDQYDRIICPSRQLLERATSKTRQPIRHCYWDSGLTQVEKKSVGVHPYKLYVPLDARTMDLTGLFAWQIIQELLAKIPGLLVTLDCAKSWPRRVRKSIFERDRVTVHYRSSVAKQIACMHEHDWMFLPSIEVSVGMTLLRAVSCNLPVVAYDIDPINQIIANGSNGLLIPGDASVKPCGSQTAMMSWAATREALGVLLSDTRTWTRLQRTDWKIYANKYRNTFVRLWSEEWEIA